MILLDFFQGIYTFFLVEPGLAFARLGLIVLGALLCYLGYRKVIDPLLMIPMGIGMLGVNGGFMVMEAGQYGTLFVNPLADNTEDLLYFLQIDFLQPIYTFLFSNGLIAGLIFLGIGAMVDVGYLIARPFSSFFLAACAELGTIFTLPIGMAMGLTPPESASIALVGGADGPMVLFGSVVMAKHLFVPISVIAYLYISITYAVYPLLTRLVPKKMRAIEMDWRELPVISNGAKFAFSIIACGLLCTLFPVASPLIACFFLGVALKEGGVTRYIDFISGPLLYGATLFLSFTLGALLSADIIMDPKVGLLLLLGIIALLLSALGGLAGGMVFSKLSRKPFNPLLGIAAVSCIPTTAKIAQKAAAHANPKAMILPYAMGPNIAGIITTAIVAGIFINGVGYIS